MDGRKLDIGKERKRQFFGRCSLFFPGTQMRAISIRCKSPRLALEVATLPLPFCVDHTLQSSFLLPKFSFVSSIHVNACPHRSNVCSLISPSHTYLYSNLTTTSKISRHRLNIKALLHTSSAPTPLAVNAHHPMPFPVVTSTAVVRISGNTENMRQDGHADATFISGMILLTPSQP